MAFKKTKGTAVSMPLGVMLGALISLLVTTILAVLLAWLMLEQKISENILGYLMMGTLVLAAVLGAAISIRKVKRRYLLTSGLTGSIYFVSLLTITAIFFGGRYEGVWINGILVAVGSLLVGILALSKRKYGKMESKKYRTC